MNQLSWCLMDEVAPHFNNPYIQTMCYLIDEKAATGKKYGDFKERLLKYLSSNFDLTNPDDAFNTYRKAYEFVKWY